MVNQEKLEQLRASRPPHRVGGRIVPKPNPKGTAKLNIESTLKHLPVEPYSRLSGAVVVSGETATVIEGAEVLGNAQSGCYVIRGGKSSQKPAADYKQVDTDAIINMLSQFQAANAAAPTTEAPVTETPEAKDAELEQLE